MIKHFPIQWWADKINKNEYFSLARFGDGELLCMEGRKGGNSHGCGYTPQLKEDLVGITRNISTNFYKGLQRITPQQFAYARQYTESGEWFNTEEFADALAKGEAKPLFEAFKNHRVVIISSKVKRAFKGFPYNRFIETPHTNTHEVKDKIVKEILEVKIPGIYLFACGMAAGTLVNTLHGKIKQSWFIDIGHLFDPFIGDNSREYLKEVPQEILNKNLP